MTDEKDVIEGEVKDLEVVDSPESRALTIGEVKEIAQVFIQSGLFKDTQDQAKAIVKIMAGNELGIGPFAAMRGFNIIQGQLAPASNLLGALIKKGGKYDYRVTESNEQKCHIEFFEGGQKIGDSEYTIEDAQRAGLTGKDNWRKYPRAMLYARCLSEGGRMHCPDVFMGSVYVPEELGADEVEGEWTTNTDRPQAATAPAKANKQPNSPTPLEKLWRGAQKRREENDGAMAPQSLQGFLNHLAAHHGDKTATDAQMGLLRGMLNKFFLSEAERHAWTEWIFGETSTKDLSGAQVLALIDWIAPEKDKDTDSYIPDPVALKESELSLRQVMIDSGQIEMMEDEDE